jgi:hypothetical protein
MLAERKVLTGGWPFAEPYGPHGRPRKYGPAAVAFLLSGNEEAGAYLSYENSVPLFLFARSDVPPTNSGGGPNQPRGPKHSPDHIRDLKDILLKPNMLSFLSQNLSLQAQTVQKWRPPEAEIQKLQKKKRLGLFSNFQDFCKISFSFSYFNWLPFLNGLSQKAYCAYFPRLFKFSPFFVKRSTFHCIPTGFVSQLVHK